MLWLAGIFSFGGSFMNNRHSGGRMTGGSNRLARAIATCVAIFSILAAAPSAFGASRVCRQLEAQLAAASGGGGSSLSRKYDAAIQKQRTQIAKARSRARAGGCGFSLFGSGGESCSALNASVKKMENNLAALQRKQGETAGGSGKSRARIMASLDANNCRDQAVAQRPISPRADNSSFLDRLFGPRKEADAPLEEAPARPARERQAPGEEGFGGQYQTVCVRTCDGYHFPMSYSSSRRDFARDQQNCEAACPGTEMQVFLQKPDGEEDDGEEAADMVSAASGAPYADLPTAYLYKQDGAPRPQSCGCNVPQSPKNYSIIAGNPPSVGDASSTSEMSMLPVSQPSDSAESLSSFVTPEPPPIAAAARVEAGEKVEITPPTDRALDAGRKVRVVGPQFLPDPSAAIDLRAPAPTPLQ
jgi:hypothetical protein